MEKWKRVFFVLLGAAGLLVAGFAWAREAGSGAAEYLDQEQPEMDYGYVLNTRTTRWQEFRPTCDALSGVELNFGKFQRQGADDWPGNAIVEIRTLSDTVLAHTVILSTAITSDHWKRIVYSPTIPISGGVRYRIAVYSDRDNSSDAWVSWRGALSSTYACAECLTDVSHSRPEFDYTFRTYCAGARLFLPLVVRDTP